MKSSKLILLGIIVAIFTFTFQLVCAQTYPNPPLDLTKSNVGADAFLTWKPPEDDGGSPVISYTVEYYLSSNFGGDNIWKILEEEILELEYNHTGGALKLYTYRVSAKNDYGLSLPSEYAGTLGGIEPLGAPAWIDIVEGYRISGTQINVTWSPAVRDGGLPILGYIVEYWPALYQNDKQNVTTNTPEVYYHVLENLEPGTSYKIRVAAYNRYGVGESLSPISVGPQTLLPRIKFKVYEDADRIYQATIYISGQTLITDLSGEVSSDYLTVGNHEFTVIKEGYENYTDIVTLVEGHGLLPVNVPLRSILPEGKIPSRIDINRSNIDLDWGLQLGDADNISASLYDSISDESILNEMVTIRLIKPSNVEKEYYRNTTTSGTAKLYYVYDEAGLWTIYAFWEGNEKYSPASDTYRLTVESLVHNPDTGIPGPSNEVILIGLIITVLYLYNRARS